MVQWCGRGEASCGYSSAHHKSGHSWAGIRQVSLRCMMTSSNGNIFRITGPLCGEFTGPGEFPTQRPVTRSFDVFFDLYLNKRLSKQPRGWWFETPLWSLWRHYNVIVRIMWSPWHPEWRKVTPTPNMDVFAGKSILPYIYLQPT